jgi:hypothetical protein
MEAIPKINKSNKSAKQSSRPLKEVLAGLNRDATLAKKRASFI